MLSVVMPRRSDEKGPAQAHPPVCACLVREEGKGGRCVCVSMCVVVVGGGLREGKVFMHSVCMYVCYSSCLTVRVSACTSECTCV